MKEIRLGIIGTCRRGKLGDLAHKPENGVRIVAGADSSEELLQSFIERYSEEYNTKVNGYSDYREMLEKERLDGVFITTPDFCHEEQALTALGADVAVYLEKPMATTIEGCDHILNTAYECRSKLFLGHNMRHFPTIIKMKELIDSGIIGDVQAVWCRHFIGYGGDAYFKDWHSERKYSTGLLVHKGAHDIDVIHWLLGSYTSRVVGMGRLSVYDKSPRRELDEPADLSWGLDHWPPHAQRMSPFMDVEDHNMLMMQMENGAQASYVQCHYTPDSGRNYTFIGTKGRLENFGDAGDAEVRVWTTRKAEMGASDITYRLEAREGSHGGADQDIVDSFVSFVKGESVPMISPVAARNAVAVGVMGHKSMRADSMPQEIPPLPSNIIEYFEKGQYCENR